ncbi:MAG: helix-turn-helix transcriptional regulator [Salinibacterium sp.]|nr:helix-turn-helix transcriptional regulator [Salinibacterium sp.]
MSIRQSLLAILDLGPCYGYQLRLEFERRTAPSSPLNVGQVYATLDRLERDGLVTKREPDSAGHVYYEITDAGHDAVREWLAAPVPAPARDDLAAKLALAMTLPGADPAALIAAQRSRATAAIAAHLAREHTTLAARLVGDARTLSTQAELHWLDRCEALIGEAEPYGLEIDPPRRGRPATATVS